MVRKHTPKSNSKTRTCHKCGFTLSPTDVMFEREIYSEEKRRVTSKQIYCYECGIIMQHEITHEPIQSIDNVWKRSLHKYLDKQKLINNEE